MRCAITVILAMLSAFILGDILAHEVFLHLTHTTATISSPSLYPAFSMQFAGLMSLVAGASVLEIWPGFSGRKKVWSIVLTIGMLSLVVSLSWTLNGAGINVLGFAVPFFMLTIIGLIRKCRKKVEK